MDFASAKTQQLARNDKSGIGAIDVPVQKLVGMINARPDYYTTSSCSGRIGLIKDGGKARSMWVFKIHDPITADQLLPHLSAEYLLWFRQEPLILHVCCETLDAAARLLAVAQNTGFKRAGIISLTPRIMIEIKSNDMIAAPLSATPASLEYIKLLVEEANKKLKENIRKIRKLEESISSLPPKQLDQ